MGQYYQPTSITNGEHIDAHSFGEGLKLMEHSWMGSPMMNTISKALMEGGKWHKHNIAWIGDYAEGMLSKDCIKCAEGELNENCKHSIKVLIGECKGTFEDLYRKTKEVKLETPKKHEFPTNYYINNHTKKEYVDTHILPESGKDWAIHPLPLLTSVGNGQGGGDFRPTNKKMEKFVGSWCGDRISITEKKLEGFKEIKPEFVE